MAYIKLADKYNSSKHICSGIPLAYDKIKDETSHYEHEARKLSEQQQLNSPMLQFHSGEDDDANNLETETKLLSTYRSNEEMECCDVCSYFEYPAYERFKII